MTQEEKQLLLKDLCARLPYKPMIRLDFQPGHGYQIGEMGIRHFWDIVRHFEDGIITTVKPYLRLISSMTEEEKLRYETFFSYDGIEYPEEYIDWHLEHHFDFRGLISMGLALEAPEGMYKNE